MDYREEIEDFASTLKLVNNELGSEIKQRKKIEEALEQAKGKAESANRAKSAFLANMSHEIRTPLNAVIGFSEILNDKINEPEYKDYLESIRTSSKSLLMLINDILDFSKIEAGKLEIKNEFANLNSLFKDIEVIFSVKIKQKKLDYQTLFSSDFPLSIKIDEVRLRQILVNLVGNAVKFTQKGGIKISSKFEPLVVLENDLMEGDLTIKVIDTGIGMSTDFQKELFEAFSQEQNFNDVEGTGLGLAISKKLVELLNGTIRIESKLNKGSEFTLSFKNILASLQIIDITQKEVVDPKSIKFPPSNVLIVDDNIQNIKYIKSALADTDLELKAVTSGMEALETISEFPASLILADLKMPKMNGFQFLTALKNNNKFADIPVIASTASALFSEREKIKKHGFNDILIKPFSMSELFSILTNYLPFEKIEVVKNTNESSDTKFELSDITDIKGLINTLEEIKNNKWNNLQQHQPIHEVIEFGTQLIGIGEKHNYNLLIDYGKQLLSAVNRFDVGKMIEIISDFTKLISNLK